MKKYLSALLAAIFVISFSFQANALDVGEEEEPTRIYCVSSLEGKRGVYTLPVGGDYSATKISGTTYIQYDFGGSGGTFTDRNTVYGSRSKGMSIFAGKATAEGGEDGPWSHVWWSWRTQPPYVDYTYEIIATDMTYDPVTKQIYGWFKADEYGLEYRLCVYDGEACSVTPVGPNSKVQINAIAADKDGRLWGVSGTLGALYSIDKNDGSLKKVGAIAASAGGENQSAAFDSATGKLYWGAVENAMKASLYCIDVASCTLEKIYDFPLGERFSAFYVPLKEASGSAPAMVENLDGRFTGSGTDVEVTFTAPDKTYSGRKLTGNVKYSLSADGTEIDAGTIAAGEAYVKTFTLSEGTHQLSVTMSNGSGNGPVATADVFVGFDEPAAVSDIKAVVNGNMVTLTWERPAGLNGGVVDLDAVTYSVTRTPELIEVAKGLTETTFTDEVPDGPVAEYTYSVTVYNGTQAGLTEVSEPLLVGKANSIPYKQDFNSVWQFGDIAYKVLNDKPSSNTWVLDDDGNGNKFVSVTGHYPENRDDYLFTAPLALKSGITYTLKFKIANDSPSDNIQLRIFLSRTQSRDENSYLKPYINPNFDFSPGEAGAGVFAEQSMTFTVEESGDYCLGFYDFGLFYTNNTISIDDIEVTAEVPESVAEIENMSVPQVTASCGQIMVSGAEGLVVSVVSVSGGEVAGIGSAPSLWTVRLAPGVYIVKAGASVVKLNVN